MILSTRRRLENVASIHALRSLLPREVFGPKARRKWIAGLKNHLAPLADALEASDMVADVVREVAGRYWPARGQPCIPGAQSTALPQKFILAEHGTLKRRAKPAAPMSFRPELFADARPSVILTPEPAALPTPTPPRRLGHAARRNIEPAPRKVVALAFV